MSESFKHTYRVQESYSNHPVVSKRHLGKVVKVIYVEYRECYMAASPLLPNPNLFVEVVKAIYVECRVYHESVQLMATSLLLRNPNPFVGVVKAI